MAVPFNVPIVCTMAVSVGIGVSCATQSSSTQQGAAPIQDLAPSATQPNLVAPEHTPSTPQPAASADHQAQPAAQVTRAEPPPLPPLLIDPDSWAKQIAPGSKPGTATPWSATALSTNSGITLYPWVVTVGSMTHVPCQAVADGGEVAISCGHNAFVVTGDGLRPYPATGVPIAKIAGHWLFNDEGMGEFGPTLWTWSAPKPQSFFAQTFALMDARGAWAVIDKTPPDGYGRGYPNLLKNHHLERLGAAGSTAPSWPAEYEECHVRSTLGSVDVLVFYLECPAGGRVVRLSYDGKGFQDTASTAQAAIADEDTDTDGAAPLPDEAPEWARSFEQRRFGERPSAAGGYDAQRRVVKAGDDYWLNDSSGIYSTRKTRFTYFTTLSRTFEGADLELVPAQATEDCPSPVTRVAKTTYSRKNKTLSELKDTYEQRGREFDLSEFSLVRYQSQLWVVREGTYDGLKDQDYVTATFCLLPQLLQRLGH